VSNALAAKNAQEIKLQRVNIVEQDGERTLTTGSAQVISQEELETYNYGDINRVLAKVPGLNLIDEEGYGNRPNIGIRGSRSERSADITIMEDGILIAPAPYAASSAYYFPSLKRMQEVQVRKGSSTIKYGPRTTSGAVNFVTKQIPTEKKAEVKVVKGNFDTIENNIEVGNSYDHWGFLVNYNHNETDGFKELDGGGDTGFDIDDFMAKLRFNTDVNADIYQEVEFKFAINDENSNETYLGLTDTDFRTNSNRRYSASQLDNFRGKHKQLQATHFIQPTANFDVTTTIYHNQFERNWYKLDKVDGLSLSDALGNSTALSYIKGADSADDKFDIKANNRTYDSKGINSIAAYQFSTGDAQHELEVGARYHEDAEDRFQHVDKYKMENGVLVQTTAAAPGSADDKVVKAQAFATFVQDKIELGKWTFLPGLRYENIVLENNDRKNSAYYHNSVDVLTPGMSVAYDWNQGLRLFGGVHKGFAPPSPPSNATNNQASAEESVNYEAGFRYSEGSFLAEATAYFTDYDNLLASDNSSGGGSGDGSQVNGGAVDVKGIEFMTKYDLASRIESRYKLPVNFSYSFTDAEFKNSFIKTEISEWGDVQKGDKLPYIAKHRFFVSTGIATEIWKLELSGKWTDRMRTQAGKGPIPDGQGTDQYFTLDLGGNYALNKHADMFFSVTNLTDEEYLVSRRPSGARGGAPRMVFAGLKLKF
jgi:Fe(3+) dicitrate transport protein